MSAAGARVHYLPSALDHGADPDPEHAATVAALVDELGALAVELADARHALTDLRAELDQTRAGLLAASATADAALGQRETWFRDGYRAAFEAGAEVGYGQAVNDWKITARDVGWYDIGQHGPTYAELDRRRYPPNGRLSWLIGRLGDLYDQWAKYSEEGGE